MATQITGGGRGCQGETGAPAQRMEHGLQAGVVEWRQGCREVAGKLGGERGDKLL